MTENSGQAAPGWYPDPSGAPRQRYYDGAQWTDQYHDAAATVAAAPGAMGGAQAAMGATAAAPVAMNPIGYWKKVMLENYTNFSGRARRSEYWWSALINIGIVIVLAVVLGAIVGTAGIILAGLYYLAALLPMVAVGIRRMHDQDKSGWWLLIGAVPLIGGIWQLVLLFTEGTRGPNQYGGPTK